MISVLIVLAGCSAENTDRGTATGDASPAETESSAPPEPPREDTDDQEVADGVQATSEGILKPGRYRTSVFKPTATFEVRKGWQLSEEGIDRLLLLHKPEPRDEAIYLDSSQRDLDVRDALMYVRDAFVGTTGSARDFRFTSVTPVRVGNARGRGTMMTLATNQLVVTLALATEAYQVRPGDKLRLMAVDVDGDTVLVFVEAPRQRFSSFLKQAERVLASLSLE